jgi:heme exporter protein A
MRLVAEQISCFRGDRLVLDVVSFSVAAGGALLLVGPNGAGKSTLLRVLAGLKRLDAGSVTFDRTAEYAGAAAYLGHQDAIKPGLTARENLAFAARIGGGDAWAALEAAGLAALADLPARMLSAGQKRRLALARLAVLGAALWLLDEPTVGLDAAAIDRFGVALAAHRERGGVVVAATHVALPVPGAEVLDLGEERPGGSAPWTPAGGRPPGPPFSVQTNGGLEALPPAGSRGRAPGLS